MHLDNVQGQHIQLPSRQCAKCMAASFQNSPQDILGGNDFKQPNLSMVQGKNACVSTHLFGVGFDYGGGGPNISKQSYLQRTR